jgi:hypothetical protein
MATHIKTDGTKTEVQPKNGTDFKLEELKEFIGGGWIEMVECWNPDYQGMVIILDEEGKLKNMPLNVAATDAYGVPHWDVIVGDVLICRKEEIL